MKLSIIIPSFNGLEYTKKCLSSIRKSGDGLEVIVVDNGSTDGSLEYLEKQQDILLLSNKENRNFAGACNQGASMASGDVLIFLNNDTEVHNNWASAIKETFQAEKNVGAVGAKLLFPNGKVQHAGVAISVDKVPRNIYCHHNSKSLYVNKTRELQAVTAACIAVPKKVFVKIGGFDEGYINGLEDIDFCLRLRRSGYRVVYEPRITAVHYESVSPGRFDRNKHNTDLYMSRWKNAVSDEHKIYLEDGRGVLFCLWMDIKHTAYSRNEYGTVPNYLMATRFFYAPVQKFLSLLILIFKGDFKTLSSKIRKVFG